MAPPPWLTVTPSLDVSARRLAITVNGDPHEVAAGESVAGLIEASVSAISAAASPSWV